jgi:molecular chaperone GrpE
VTEQPADDVPGGSVLMVMQAGYELFGRVIRPAMVAVAAKTAAPQAAAPSKNGYDHDSDETGASVNTQAE